MTTIFDEGMAVACNASRGTMTRNGAAVPVIAECVLQDSPFTRRNCFPPNSTQGFYRIKLTLRRKERVLHTVQTVEHRGTHKAHHTRSIILASLILQTVCATHACVTSDGIQQRYCPECVQNNIHIYSILC